MRTGIGICSLDPGLQRGGGAGISMWHGLKVTHGLQGLCKVGRQFGKLLA